MPTKYSYTPPGARPPRKPAPPPVVDYRVKLLSAVNSMPPLPSVLNRLLGMLASERCSAGQIAAMIEQDSVLSGSVLRSVNSAYYGLPARVSSIRQAVTLLGFRTVRNLALAFSMRRMMAGNQQSRAVYSAYSRHALGCAIMTQFLAHFTRAHDLEAAFAAGLFHDIGKLLILTKAPEALERIVGIWEQGEKSYEAAEREVLEITHSELSAIVLDGWKLPPEIRDAARYHHEPNDEPDDEPEKPSLARLVHAADLAVNYEGFQTVPSKKRPAASPEQAFRAIGLGENLPQLLEQFKTEFSGLQGAFS